jgi:hypothetical protein
VDCIIAFGKISGNGTQQPYLWNLSIHNFISHFVNELSTDTNTSNLRIRGIESLGENSIGIGSFPLCQNDGIKHQEYSN